jgi:hypothetical protein
LLIRFFLDESIEPLYVLQIAISLFSAIADAHTLNVGLVNISMDTLWLGLDGAVYFDAFKSCLILEDEEEKQPWINFDQLQCPGNLLICQAAANH